MTRLLSTGDIAERFNVDVWRIRRLFEDGTFAEPDRFAGKRVISAALLPRIANELRRRGWIEDRIAVGAS